MSIGFPANRLEVRLALRRLPACDAAEGPGQSWQGRGPAGPDTVCPVTPAIAAMVTAVKRLDRGLQRQGETAECVLGDLKEADPRLRALGELMRADLGVER